MTKHRLLPCLLLLTACGNGQNTENSFAGYLEGDYRYLAPAVSGRLQTLSVAQGEHVSAGQTLFALDDTSQQAALATARAQTDALRAQQDDMASGQRSEEIARIEAQLAQAEAQERLAANEHARLAKLVKSRAISASDADNAKAQHDIARAKARELRSTLAIARLPARPAQRAQIAAQIRAAQAETDARQWQIAQTRLSAPQAGQITHIYFREGEWVSAGQPVLALLPPADMKALFYVPATTLPRLSAGTRVQLACSGCPPLTATIRHIADRPEYTPPVLYSEDSQHTLSYRIEAQLDTPHNALHPGQPVTVRLP